MNALIDLKQRTLGLGRGLLEEGRGGLGHKSVCTKNGLIRFSQRQIPYFPTMVTSVGGGGGSSDGCHPWPWGPAPHCLQTALPPGAGSAPSHTQNCPLMSTGTTVFVRLSTGSSTDGGPGIRVVTTAVNSLSRQEE